MRLECDCGNTGTVVRDADGDIVKIEGQFHEGDRKSGNPILCDACGSEVDEEDDEE